MISNSDRHEWVIDSGIDALLTSLNIVSLSNHEPHEYLLYGLERDAHRNNGVLRNKYLTRYDHLYHGGWWCSGVDVLTGEDSEWGCFKPNLPHESEKKPKGFDPNSNAKNKKIKYEHPPKVATEIFALKVPLHIWQAIASRYNVTLPENIVVTPEGRAIGFWSWVINNPRIPLIITEGAKKAGCLITNSYVAIALPGIYNGYRQPKNQFGQKIGKPYLIPQLKVFAQKGREIIFAMDHDTKPATIENVERAIKTTGGLFAHQGCKISVITWDYPEKGVDDLIVARGRDCFHNLYVKRMSFSKFNLVVNAKLSKYSPLIIDERYLSDNLVTPEDAQVIGVKSAKNTGKTQWLSHIVSKAMERGQRVIIICHRKQLAITLARRFGLDYRTEIRTSVTQGVFGYALCIDSLHPHANPSFNPDDWREALVVMDEAEQVIWHMLNSKTCRNNRTAIIESFKLLLQTAIGTGGKVFLADADLSSTSLDYILSCIGFPVNTWVVENKNNPNLGKRKAITYRGNDPRQLLSALETELQNGLKALIHTTGQKAESKWGTINLECYLKNKYPDSRILRIDSESTCEPCHPAFRCTGNLNELVAQYDIVIVSPVLETGVSIDIKGHFDSVWCIAYGVQSVNAVCQTIERLRDDVLRHIWVKATAKNNKIGNGSVSVRQMWASQDKLTMAHMNLLREVDINEYETFDVDVNYSPESLSAWAKFGCVENEGKNNYRANVEAKLEAEGYELIRAGDNLSQDTDLINQTLKETRDNNYRSLCNDTAEIDAPTKNELKELEQKKTLTKKERLQKRKGTLSNRYGVEVTPELVAKDDRGWYNQLQLHYYFTIGQIYLAQRDRRSIKKLTFNSKGKAFKVDINQCAYSAQIQGLELLDMRKFLDPNAEFTANSEADWFERIKGFAPEIKTLYGVGINPKTDTPIEVANRILGKMDLKLEFKYWRGSRKTKQRVYSGCKLDPDSRSRIFANWLAQDEIRYSHTPVLTKC